MLMYYLIAFILIGLDQWTKYLTVRHIPLHAVKDFLPGFLSFTYIQNTGSALSILEGKMVFFYIVTVAVIAGIIFSLHKYGKEEPLFSLSLSFILGGAIGNFIDRLVHQYVVDM